MTNKDGDNSPGQGDAARRAAEVKKVVKPPAAGSPPPRRRPGDKPFIPFARFEDIVVRCGHVEKFGLLPEGKDRFREGRRKKALSRDCKACRLKKQQAGEELAEQRRLEKEKRKMQQTEQQSGSGKGSRPQTGRLPDGSHFEVRYDAAKEQWHGSLTVPKPGEAAATFVGSGSGLFPLLTSLDKQYRATLT